jgi:4'-phosphopantetheinyl transferase
MLNFPVFEEQLDESRYERGQDVLHLWTAKAPRARSLEADACPALMAPEERRRKGGLSFDRDKRANRSAHALTRAVLSRYVEVDPRRLRFAKGSAGKPELAYPADSALQFSLSHTDGMAVLLVSWGPAVGVDVESEQRFTPAEIPLSLLGATEGSKLRSLPRQHQVRRFLEYWTLKESYAKALGTGLILPLDRYEFAIDADGIRANIDPVLDPNSGRWWFSHHRIPGFVTALAASLHEVGEAPPQVRVFSAVTRE